MGATTTNMIEEWERRSDAGDRKMAAIIELLEILTRQVMETKSSMSKSKLFGDKDMEIKFRAMSMQVESDYGEDDDLYYGAMLFRESIEAVLLNCEGEGVEGFEE
ncbi:hypothetical protein HAX54_053010, partial [Datura stramonium]|nr:hypothetical protein [Datura stramonium]